MQEISMSDVSDNSDQWPPNLKFVALEVSVLRHQVSLVVEVIVTLVSYSSPDMPSK